MYAYYIMPKYQLSLEQYFESANRPDIQQRLDIACQLLEIFKIVHKSGIIYNDLKLQNVMIDFDEKTNEPVVSLTDFGFASSYLKLHGEHISEKQSVKYFRGNLMFSSVN